MSIDELELRPFLQLPQAAGINTVEELCNKTPEEMMKVRNLAASLWKKSSSSKSWDSSSIRAKIPPEDPSGR